MLGKQLTQAAAGSAAGESLYVDDVFATHLYEGNGSTQTITHGIDITGEGGMTWMKRRSGTSDYSMFDTERGFSSTASVLVWANKVDTQLSMTSYVNATTNGFVLNHSGNDTNDSGSTYVSWNFRKARGFFDVVTYTGNGTAGRTISHSLGSVPGAIWVKCTSHNNSWGCYHRSTGNTSCMFLNDTIAPTSNSTPWNNTDPTSTEFTVGSDGQFNGNNKTYVAYIFAHDDQSFGEDRDEAIIKCDSYTGTGSTGFSVNVGFDPQFLIIKRTDSAEDWHIFDNMRGVASGGNDTPLKSNNNYSESGGVGEYISFTPTGFQVDSTGSPVGSNGGTYSYIAIRRPHKPPESATDVFAVQATRAASDATPDSLYFTSGFPVDLMWQLAKNSASNAIAKDRLQGANFLRTSESAAEISNTGYKLDTMEGVYADGNNSANSNFAGLLFKRAPGFLDILHYTGNGTAGRNLSHNLGSVPGLIIVKKRSGNANWAVYHGETGNVFFLLLDEADQASVGSYYWHNTSPTSTVFTVGNQERVNENNSKYVAYLFGNLDGISKVGSYTGTGNDIDIDCGFTNGARFVMVKRTDATGDWFVMDTARGIGNGDDPYILLNTTGGEVNNNSIIDPYSSGFQITGDAPAGMNASGGTYLYLAIA